MARASVAWKLLPLHKYWFLPVCLDIAGGKHTQFLTHTLQRGPGRPEAEAQSSSVDSSSAADRLPIAPAALPFPGVLCLPTPIGGVGWLCRCPGGGVENNGAVGKRMSLVSLCIWNSWNKQSNTKLWLRLFVHDRFHIRRIAEGGVIFSHHKEICSCFCYFAYLNPTPFHLQKKYPSVGTRAQNI